MEDWVFLWISSPFKTCFGKHQSTGMESLPMWAVSKILGCFVEKARLQIRSSLGCHHFGMISWSIGKTKPLRIRRSQVFDQPSGILKWKRLLQDVWKLYDGTLQFVRFQRFSEAKNGFSSTWKSQFLKIIQIDLHGWPIVSFHIHHFDPFFRILHPDCTAPFSNLWQVWFVAWVQTPAQFLF